jgi:hypothetical protein
MEQNVLVNLSDPVQRLIHRAFSTDFDPIVRKAHNLVWSNKLLQCEAPCKPSAALKGGTGLTGINIAGYIFKMCIADLRFLIPRVHGID